jgi:8-oxo-dGTP pyrophosphatase MutT (NUDIX family)
MEKCLKQQAGGPPEYPTRRAATAWDADGYNPQTFHIPLLLSEQLPPWADPMDLPASVVGARLSYYGGTETTIADACQFDHTTRKFRNPIGGPTGLAGRGSLGKWGANHAADCIVTRLHPETAKPQALMVTRTDGDGESALAWPGGMVDPGDEVPATLRAELTQEAVEEGLAVERLFTEGRRGVVYRGPVDDHRNTDNAWMETTAVHFHATPDVAAAMNLSIRDTHEVSRVAWMDLDEVTVMYASHMDWLVKLRDEIMPALLKPANKRSADDADSPACKRANTTDSDDGDAEKLCLYCDNEELTNHFMSGGNALVTCSCSRVAHWQCLLDVCKPEAASAIEATGGLFKCPMCEAV